MPSTQSNAEQEAEDAFDSHVPKSLVDVVVPVAESKDLGTAEHLEHPLIPRLSTNEKDLFASFKLFFYRIVRAYWDNYVWLILTASVGFALTFTCVKVLSEEISVFQITAVRATASTLMIFAMCWWNGVSIFEPRERLPLMIARGVTGGCAFLCMSLATFQLPLSNSAFMANSYPVVTAMLSWMFGMEELRVMSWVGIGGCVVGNALVAHPPFLFGGNSDWGPKRVIGISAAIVGNLLMGAAFILIRYIGGSVNSMSLTAYLHIFSFVVSLPFLLASYPKPVNTRHSMLELECYGIMFLTGVFAQLAQSRALQIGPPTKTTTLLMTNMLLSGFLGVVVLSESMSWLSAIGAIVILISVMMVTMQDSTKRPRPGDSEPLLSEGDQEE